MPNKLALQRSSSIGICHLQFTVLRLEFIAYLLPITVAVIYLPSPVNLLPFFCFHSPFTVNRLSFIVYYLSFSNHHLSFFDSLRVKSLIFDSDFLRKAFLIPNLSSMSTNASKGPLNTWLQNRVRPYKMSLFQCIWMVSVICLL